jgi:ER membrane protein complex subunit 1
MAAPPHRPLLILLAGLLVVASLATLAEAIYEDQVGLADWYVPSSPRSDPPLA